MRTTPPIQYRAKPVGEVGPLVPQLHQSSHIMAMNVQFPRPAPVGLNIDGIIVFDMQMDGGVDGIELVYHFGEHLRSGVNLPRPSEQYFRLFLSPSGKELFLGDRLEERVSRDHAEFLFGRGKARGRVLVGPDVWALVEGDELRGLRIGLTNFQA